MQNESSTKRASLNQINQILQSLSLSILFIFLEILYCYTLKKLKKKEKNFFCLPKFKFEIHFARWVESSQAKNDLQSLMNVDMRICSIKTSDFCTLFLFKLKILEILLDLKPTKKKKAENKMGSLGSKPAAAAAKPANCPPGCAPIPTAPAAKAPMAPAPAAPKPQQPCIPYPAPAPAAPKPPQQPCIPYPVPAPAPKPQQPCVPCPPPVQAPKPPAPVNPCPPGCVPARVSRSSGSRSRRSSKH